MLTINEGAMMTGSNLKNKQLENSSIRLNGTLRPGNYEGAITGTIFFGGKDMTINETGVLSITANKCMTSATNGCTGISNIGTLVVNGTILVTPSKSNTLKVGDSIRIWSDVAAASGTFKVVGANGIEWDDSRLISEGLLFVKDIDTGIRNINSTDNTFDIYDLGGHLVRKAATSTEGLKPGIYIIEGRKIVVK